MIDLSRRRFGCISWWRIPNSRIWIRAGRLGAGKRSPIVQTKVQRRIGVRAITGGAALHLVFGRFRRASPWSAVACHRFVT